MIYETQKIWQNQHGYLIRFCEFQRNLTEDVFPHPNLTTLDPNKTRPRITLMPLVMGPFLYKNSRLLDESQENIMSRESSFFPPKNLGIFYDLSAPFLGKKAESLQMWKMSMSF